MLVLIDAAAILNNQDFSFEKGISYLTTAEVVREMKDFRSRAVIDNALHNGLLRIEAPSQESLKKAGEKARKAGMRLSRADLSLIALAIDCREKGLAPEVLTDDYSVQNMLSFLGIRFSPVIREGIRRAIELELFCPGCGKKYAQKGTGRKCDFCGAGLKKRRKKP